MYFYGSGMIKVVAAVGAREQEEYSYTIKPDVSF
jgi:hypothetical protein